MSPRRSSRARSTQNPPPLPPHTHSSASSATSSTASASHAKAERSTRSNNNRTTSPRLDSVHRSESVDEVDAESRSQSTSRLDHGPSRRSRRGVTAATAEVEKDGHVVVGNTATGAKHIPNHLPDAVRPDVGADAEADGEAIEEEVTRCICGHAEYPGPGSSVREQYPDNGETLSDDVGNFFVQCDNCHVWQHGGCMGLTDEVMLPDEYYCEQCRPENHRVIKTANSKSSRYLPVLEGSARSSPLSSAAEVGRKKDALHRSLESTKRRATMNSRSAYDEDEALRQAIEESKVDGTLGKRSREDDECVTTAQTVPKRAATDNHGSPRLVVKRQRTTSSASSTSQPSRSPGPTNESGSRLSTKIAKLRGVVARNNREKEVREKLKQEMAAMRAEAASKRNARSERRRQDDSPPPTPSLSPSKAAAAASAHHRVKAETPPATRAVVSRKPGGRPGTRRGRVGRNQYTRDMALVDDLGEAAHRDTSHDRNGAASPHPNGVNGESGRSSKAKTHPARTSMNEMKRRVAAILEFVGQMQTQHAKTTTTASSSNPQSNRSHGGSSHSSTSAKGNSTPNGTGSSSGVALPTSSLVQAVAAGLEDARKGQEEGKFHMADELLFGRMGSQEMMETLTKELVQWQTLFGIYSR